MVGLERPERGHRRASHQRRTRTTARELIPHAKVHGSGVRASIVHPMDRLARDLDDLRRLVRLLTGKGVRVEFVKESLIFTGEDSPMATLLRLILERQREGVAAAKARGAYAGRKPVLITEQAGRLRDRAAAGESKSLLAKEFGISRETVYSCLRADTVTGPAR
ncbi:recombinase family protein [Nocardia sp. NPDC046763]|uniref:recombinase family protein n=1 Tax=Nocardia sp. NPDC046763 TaxID=3155256 RepID=UPI0033CFE4FD